MSQIEYTVSESDVVAFSDYHLAHSPSQKRTLRLLHLGFGGFFLLLWVIVWIGGESFGNALPIFVLAGAWLVFIPVRVRQNRRRVIRKLHREGENRAFLGPQQIRIDPEGLAYRSASGEGRLNWTAIEKVATTPDYAFLYVSAMNAIVIPRKSVTTGDYQEFLRELQGRIAPTAAPASPESPYTSSGIGR